MRICIFGAGSIGGYLAASLAQGGAKVSVVARGAHLAAIKSNGLTVESPDGTLNARLPASDTPADLGPQDAVIVTVKAPALPAVAASITPLLGPDTPVAFVMNGIPWWYFPSPRRPPPPAARSRQRTVERSRPPPGDRWRFLACLFSTGTRRHPTAQRRGARHHVRRTRRQ